MKKFIILFFILGITACTDYYHANTEVRCPCVVVSIHQQINDYYIIKIKEVDNTNTNAGRWLSFYTGSRTYHLGDTIK